MCVEGNCQNGFEENKWKRNNIQISQNECRSASARDDNIYQPNFPIDLYAAHIFQWHHFHYANDFQFDQPLQKSAFNLFN